MAGTHIQYAEPKKKPWEERQAAALEDNMAHEQEKGFGLRLNPALR